MKVVVAQTRVDMGVSEVGEVLFINTSQAISWDYFSGCCWSCWPAAEVAVVVVEQAQYGGVLEDGEVLLIARVRIEFEINFLLRGVAWCSWQLL